MILVKRYIVKRYAEGWPGVKAKDGSFEKFVGICFDGRVVNSKLDSRHFLHIFCKKDWSHGLVVSVDSMWENVSKKCEKCVDCWEGSGHYGTPEGGDFIISTPEKLLVV